MGLKIYNNTWMTLAAGIAAGDVTINVTAGHGARVPLSAGEYCYGALITSGNAIEVIKITARSTDALTAVRGQDGTTAIAFSAGDRLEIRPCNAAIQAAMQEANNATALAGTDTYTGTLSPVPTAYNTGQVYFCSVANTNTVVAPTVNLNSLGAKTIKRVDGTALTAGDLAPYALLQYNGTDMLLLNPANTTAAQLAFIKTNGAPAVAPTSTQPSGVSIGDGNSVIASYGVTLGGQSNQASAQHAATIGGFQINARRIGQVSFGAMLNYLTGLGSIVIAEAATSNATPTEMRCRGSGQITVRTGELIVFRIHVGAYRNDVPGEVAAYEFTGAIRNIALTTALLVANKTVLYESTAAWDVAVTGDDLNDSLVITVTGEAGKTITWVARIDMCEVGPGV